MTVISVSIIASEEQIVSGFPTHVSISTNIYSNIFYTLDGTTPTLFSTIYIGPILLPTDKPTLILSIFATDGVNSSPIITEIYQTNVLHENARTSHSGTNVKGHQAIIDPAPFGSPPIQPNQKFLGAAEAGLTVFDPLKPIGPPQGYDANGDPAGFTNDQEKTLPTKKFPFIYSDSNAEGGMGYGIGTLPREITIKPIAPPERSDVQSQFFDPRAFVIIQDLTVPQDPGLPQYINRQFMTLESINRTREGNQYYNTGNETPPPSGSFVRREFDASRNIMKYYYYDSWAQRWVISTTPYKPTQDQYNYAGSMVIGNRKSGDRNVYSWIPFKGNWIH